MITTVLAAGFLIKGPDNWKLFKWNKNNIFSSDIAKKKIFLKKSLKKKFVHIICANVCVL